MSKVRTTRALESPLTYKCWIQMRRRIYNKNHHLYPKYGGAGMKIHPRWDKFDNFLDDMGERPSMEYTVDRIDGTKGYQPGNCRWATMKEQSANRKTTRWLEIKGIRKPIGVWADEFRICRATVLNRIKRGLSPVDALMRPINPNGFRLRKNEYRGYLTPKHPRRIQKKRHQPKG